MTGPLLQAALDAAVPLWIEQIKRECWSFAEIQRVARDTAQVVAAEGDNILFRGPKRGDTARAFNALARGIACLSFAPGGVRVFGRRWEATLEEGTP